MEGGSGFSVEGSSGFSVEGSSGHSECALTLAGGRSSSGAPASEGTLCSELEGSTSNSAPYPEGRPNSSFLCRLCAVIAPSLRLPLLPYSGTVIDPDPLPRVSQGPCPSPLPYSRAAVLSAADVVHLEAHVAVVCSVRPPPLPLPYSRAAVLPAADVVHLEAHVADMSEAGPGKVVDDEHRAAHISKGGWWVRAGQGGAGQGTHH